MSKKCFLDLKVHKIDFIKDDLIEVILKPSCGETLPPMQPGQFIELQVPTAKSLLNRPISIFDCTESQLTLLVKIVGTATLALSRMQIGSTVGVIAPLGSTFRLDAHKPLLIGGGVGVAPMYYLAKSYNKLGIRPTLIYGERTKPADSLVNKLSTVADIHICSDDGSSGFHGLVTNHPICSQDGYDIVQTCGPAPMMRAVGKLAKTMNVPCEVSLENKMACGLGACLCCVENTTTGHRCVCTDGPVFNTEELTW